jgi:hypothetical protein
VETILDAYGDAGFDGILHNKWENFVQMAGGSEAIDQTGDAIDLATSGKFEEAIAVLRGPRFFSLLPFLGLFLVAPFAMLIGWARRRENPREWHFALLCFFFAGVGCVAWGLILYSETTLHVGSFTVPLLALCGCVVGLRATFPRFAAFVVALNVLLVLVLYVPSLTPIPGTSYSPVAALVAFASLVGFAAVAFLPLRGDLGEGRDAVAGDL